MRQSGRQSTSGRGYLKRRNAVQSDVGRVPSAHHGCSQRLRVRSDCGHSHARQVSRCLCHDSTCCRHSPGRWRATTLPCCLASRRHCRRPGYKLLRSTGNRPSVSTKIVLFGRYDQEAPSAKDHDRTRRGIDKAFRLTPNTLLPCR